jgi:hypothetical protein
MLSISEINKVAEKAIDDAFAHYFVHLASGQDKIDEAKFIAELLQMLQPWLFFSEGTLEATHDFIYKDQLHINLIYSLTAIFRQRFAVDVEECNLYVKHIANSFDTKECTNEKESLMSEEYRNRLMAPSSVESLLKNNRPLVMMATAMLFLDTNILALALDPKR